MGENGPPALTPAQRESALQKATAVRMRRRAFKDAIARGEHTLGAALVLAKADDALTGIKMIDLLQAYQGVGPVRAEALMRQSGIALSRRIRGVGARQTELLLRRYGS